jgi:phosphate uptake regulator
MACPSQENPYFNMPTDLREDTVISDLDITFSLEEDEIIEALNKAVKMYETPTVRAYNGITTMLDNLTEYMSTTSVTAGRDGNINSLLRIAKEFDAIRQSYKGIAKDLEAEQEAHVRGGQQLGYDQI